MLTFVSFFILTEKNFRKSITSPPIVVAALIRQFFVSLPDPLLTMALFDEWVEATSAYLFIRTKR